VSDPLAVAAVTLAGLLVGVLLRRSLGGAAYRLDDEQDRPVPRWGWLVAVAVPVVWGLLAARLGVTAALPPVLLLAAVGVALTRIDLDVHRLPEGLTLPAIAAVFGLQVVAAVLTGDWWALGRGVVCGVLSWLGYLVLVLLSRGSLGLGDATLGGLVGLTLGNLDGTWPLYAVGAAFLLGGVVSALGLVTRRLTLRSHIAFGPYILAGALVVALAAPA
jgi:leader peptidase (prepilin peptidase)/N-methyltransferase